MPNIFCSNTSQNAQLRAITLSLASFPGPIRKIDFSYGAWERGYSLLQTAWTGFDPNLYSGGSSSACPAPVDLAVTISTRAGPAEDDPPLYNLGSNHYVIISTDEHNL